MQHEQRLTLETCGDVVHAARFLQAGTSAWVWQRASPERTRGKCGSFISALVCTINSGKCTSSSSRSATNGERTLELNMVLDHRIPLIQRTTVVGLAIIAPTDLNSDASPNQQDASCIADWLPGISSDPWVHIIHAPQCRGLFTIYLRKNWRPQSELVRGSSRLKTFKERAWRTEYSTMQKYRRGSVVHNAQFFIPKHGTSLIRKL